MCDMFCVITDFLAVVWVTWLTGMCPADVVKVRMQLQSMQLAGNGRLIAPSLVSPFLCKRSMRRVLGIF